MYFEKDGGGPERFWRTGCRSYAAFWGRREKSAQKSGYQMVVLTAADTAERVLADLKESDRSAAGVCLVDGNQAAGEIEGVPVVSAMDGLLDYIRHNVVDGLFVHLPQTTPAVEQILSACAAMGVSTHLIWGCSSPRGPVRVVEKLGRYTVLTHRLHCVTPRQRLFKRAVDLCAGLVGVLVTAVAFLFVAPAIYAASPGPIFFSQMRVGQNGRTFKIYKFRSMHIDAEQQKQQLLEHNKVADGMMFKIDDDPRIIAGIGRFIRDYSIDELPQLWNVLKGEMSLIGTRPPTVEEYERYCDHHKARLAIKPGITGLWQVSGRSNITDFEQVVALDISYMQNWSLQLDCKILLKTVRVVLKKDGAV